MGITKKLLIVAAALSLSACTMFEGKNTFMTYQDLQTKVRQHDSELKAMQDQLAQLKQKGGSTQSGADSSSSAQSDDGLGLSQSETMAAPSVAPAITPVHEDDQSSSVQSAPVASNSNDGSNANGNGNNSSSASTPPIHNATPAVQKAPMKSTSSAGKANQSSGTQYGVQLAAYGTRQEAVHGWRVLNKQSADVFVNLDPHVTQAQVNGRTMYQLKVGPFLDRAYSVGFCNMLKQKGRDCIVKKFDGEPL